MDKAALHIGAEAFIRRFCSSLNKYVHFKIAWWLACRDRWTSRKRALVVVGSRCRADRQFEKMIFTD